MRISMSNKWRPFVGVGAIGLLAFSVSVYGGPRVTRVDKEPGPEGKVVPQVVHTGWEVIHSSRPVPPRVEGRLEQMPIGVPIPTFMVHNDGSPVLSGRTADVDTSAPVYLQPNDSSYFFPWGKGTDVGNFAAHPINLGNGFTPGDSVSRITATVYNSVTGYGKATVRLSLWDGDPMGIKDTRINDPPQMIAGTKVTFTDLYQGGRDPANNINVACTGGYCVGGFLEGEACTDWSDCGLCPVGVANECPGMFELVATYDPPIVIPTEQPWMMMEVLAGCRLGWRSAWYAAPTVGAGGGYGMPSAPGCGDVLGPCTDYIEEVYYHGQKDNTGFGTCCDTGDACDHDNGYTTDDCSHPTFCTSGAVDDYDYWYYGAPTYFASFVAGAYSPAGPTVTIFPTASSGASNIDGSTIEMEVCPQEVWFEIEIANWDPELEDDPGIKTWQVKIDPSGYTGGASGYLTPYNPACVLDDDAYCEATLGTGSTCTTDEPASGYPPGGCAPGWQYFGDDPLLGLGIDAPSIATLEFAFGSTTMGALAYDDGVPHTGAFMVMTMSTDAAGIFTVGLNPGLTFIKNGAGNAIPFLGLIPAKVDCMLGQCCDLSGGVGNFVCVSDGVTKADCTGVWTHNAICDDAIDDNLECGCTENYHCDDGDACTTDTCTAFVCSSVDAADYDGLCCNKGTGGTTVLDDLDQCTFDECDGGTERGDATHTNTDDDCDDGNVCTYDDVCDIGTGECAGTPVNAAMIPCTSSADCETETEVPHPCVGGYCFCQLAPPMGFLPPIGAPDDNCYPPTTKVELGIHVGASAGYIVGGQFTVTYDDTCLEYVSIVGVAPYTMDIMKIENPGEIFYAVGIDPLVGGGTYGDVDMALMTFTKLGDCTTCQVCIGGENPYEARLTDDEGQAIDVVPECTKMLMTKDVLTLEVPDDLVVNTFCDKFTAEVYWDAPTASSDCYDVDLVCSGLKPDATAYTEAEAMGGGVLPQGVSTFTCTATSTMCDDNELIDSWTVTVNETVTLDVDIQLSPIMSGDVTRCIGFELYEDCVQDSFPFDAELFFGGDFNHVGQYTGTLKIPSSGKWACITAMDQLHSLRSVDMLECGADGVYHAVFKGDPFFDGGNWLIQGNLDAFKKDNPLASHDVIDITDFGQLVGNYLATPDPNTPCPLVPDVGHADINGDGIVNMVDYTFIQMNFMMHSKDSCCPDVTASVPTGRTEISLRELRAAGMGDLSIADLNRDGLLNVDDMRAFEAGAVPVKKAPRRGAGIR